MRFRTVVVVLAFLAAVLAPAAAMAQAPPSEGKVGIAVQLSSLGIGGDIAVKLSPKANIRAGANKLSLTRDFDDDDGNVVTATAKVQSMHAFLDWFPRGGGFRLSPGLVFANDTQASLAGLIVGGKNVEIGDIEYRSNPANPIKLSGGVSVKSTAFAVTMGWGNIVGRARRWSVPFEIGVVFQGAPTAAIAFSGSACNTNGTNCRDVSTDAAIQAEVKKQNTELNADLNKPYTKYFPIITLGFGIRF